MCPANGGCEGTWRSYKSYIDKSIVWTDVGQKILEFDSKDFLGYDDTIRLECTGILFSISQHISFNDNLSNIAPNP